MASDAALRRYASPCGAVSQWRHVDVLFSTMSDEGRASYCFECKQALTEIDNDGTRLWGCMNCNIWWSLRGAKVRLSEEDLRALHQLRRGN